MPKRRSLVGTGREAIGEAPATRTKTPPVPPEPPIKHARPAPKAKKKVATREPTPAPRPEAAAPRERERVVATSPATAYEAMMSFASATLRQNMETGARLARCKSPMEALATQTAHATAVAQSLFAVSLKLMQLGFSSASWSSLRRESRPDAL
jgi:outer membrane biosynthesis protein TonB